MVKKRAWGKAGRGRDKAGWVPGSLAPQAGPSFNGLRPTVLTGCPRLVASRAGPFPPHLPTIPAPKPASHRPGSSHGNLARGPETRLAEQQMSQAHPRRPPCLGRLQSPPGGSGQIWVRCLCTHPTRSQVTGQTRHMSCLGLCPLICTRGIVHLPEAFPSCRVDPSVMVDTGLEPQGKT